MCNICLRVINLRQHKTKDRALCGVCVMAGCFRQPHLALADESGAGWGGTPVVHRLIKAHRLNQLSPHTQGVLAMYHQLCLSFFMSTISPTNRIIHHPACVLLLENPQE